MNEHLKSKKNWKPNRKVAEGALGIGGASGVVIAWLLTSFGVDVPEPVAAAFGSVCSFIASYLLPETRG